MKRNSEDLLIATLLQYPELFENLMLSVDMFEVPDYQKAIQFFIEEGKADKHPPPPPPPLYTLKLNHTKIIS
ncbi:hypothetical protein NIT62_08765 [Mammaliicoccus sciuri]|nr:hypothetical protein NIT62_08765 [Mammaliicoccus sciuri]